MSSGKGLVRSRIFPRQSLPSVANAQGRRRSEIIAKRLEQGTVEERRKYWRAWRGVKYVRQSGMQGSKKR